MKFTAAQLKRFTTGRTAACARCWCSAPTRAGARARRRRGASHRRGSQGSVPRRRPRRRQPAVRSARLADEAAAISMMGGRRLVKIGRAGDRHAALFREFLAAPPGDGFVLVTADELARSSSLRKAFEEAPNAAAIECGYDSAETLDSLIDQVLGAAGLTVSEDARLHLRANLAATG